jgi:hypothetical protein
MAQNFLTCDRDQPLLLPPDLRDWLPEDHLGTEASELRTPVLADAPGRRAARPRVHVSAMDSTRRCLWDSRSNSADRQRSSRFNPGNPTAAISQQRIFTRPEWLWSWPATSIGRDR